MDRTAGQQVPDTSKSSTVSWSAAKSPCWGCLWLQDTWDYRGARPPTWAEAEDGMAQAVRCDGGVSQAALPTLADTVQRLTGGLPDLLDATNGGHGHSSPSLEGNLPRGRGTSLPLPPAGMQATPGPGLQCSALTSTTQWHTPRRWAAQVFLPRSTASQRTHARLGGSGACRAINWMPPGGSRPELAALHFRAAILRRP